MNKFGFLFRHSPVVLASYVYFRLIYSVRLHLMNQRYFIKKIYDYIMVLDLEDLGLSRALMFFGQRELEHKYLLQKFLNKGDTVLDLGANIGYYANMEAQVVGDTGKIIAIEPNPDNVRLLKLNLLLNNNADKSTVIHGAGGSETGEGTLFLSDRSNLHSFIEDQNSNGKTIQVPLFNISSIIDQWGEFDFLRMDIEGFEVKVLESLVDALPKMQKRPKILFETHLPKYDESFNLESSMKALFENGYRVGAIASNEAPNCSLRVAGYTPSLVMKTDGRKRGIYETVSNEDAIQFVNRLGGVRAILFVHSDSAA